MYGYIIVTITFLVMLLTLGLQASFGLLVKPLTEDLGSTRTIISGAYSLAQIVYGIFAVVIGLLSDRFGPRVSVTLCGVAAGLGCLLMSQVHSVWQIYLFYGFIFGIGNSIFVPLLSFVAKFFVQRRGLMTGIALAGGGFGMLIMPPFISWFLSSYNWRLSFLIVGIAILIMSVVAAVLLRSRVQVQQVASGENTFIRESVKPEYGGFSFKEAVRTNQLWLMCIILICYSCAFVSLEVHVVPYMTDMGISSSAATAVLTVLGGAAIVGQTVLGSLGDKIGYKKAYLLGLVMIALAAFTVAAAGEPWVFFVFAVLLGLAFGTCGTQSSPMIAWLFGLRSHGLFLGIFSFSFTIGASIGPLMFGYIFDATNSYHFAFWISIALAIAAVILMSFLKHPAANVSPEPVKFE